MTETAAAIKVTNPTKKAPDGIYVYHDVENKTSLGLELNNGVVFGALAVCNPKDQFSKKDAQTILRRRLNFKRTGRWSVLDISDYTGDSFKDDVFLPRIQMLRDLGPSVAVARKVGDLRSALEGVNSLLSRSP